MITFFKDDMQNKMYTDAFLNNTSYYDSLCEIYKNINELIRQYKIANTINANLIDDTIYLWNSYAYSRKYNCSNIGDFFYIKDDELRDRLIRQSQKYGINSFGPERLFTNLYDIQKGIKTAGIKTVDKSDITKDRINTTTTTYVEDDKKYVIKLTSNGRASRYIIVRFRFSLGIFDTIEYKMVAYKNFKTEKIYGQWSALIEKYAVSIYNISAGIETIKVDKPKESKAVDIVEKENTNKLHNSATKLQCEDVLNTSLDRLSKFHRVSDKEIKKILKDSMSEKDIAMLNEYIELVQMDKFEAVVRKLYADAFIKLINYKSIADIDVSKEAKDYYYKLTGKRIQSHNGCRSVRNREYRQLVKRGTLMNSRGDTIYGGSNKANQTQINIKINDADFTKLCNSFGINNPNQSELNGIVEEVLKQKFESFNQYSLSNKAKLMVLCHRDKREQSKISSLRACYIPCEYNAYITKIQKANYGSANFKNSKTFVLSVILHEYIGYI